ncbi:MAG: major capsid protein [Porticoccaceae bacterium]|nr:major capsid protein [Porticoccaceae bacterium]
MLDIFKSNAFTLRSLTAAVNERPFVPGRLGSMGLFTNSGINTTTIAIENIKGTLRLIDTTKRGGPGVQHTPDKRKMRNLNAVHIQPDDHINADEVQNVREFGQDNQAKSLQSEVMSRFDSMNADIDATMEHLRMGAIKGELLDADGSTVIYDLFTEFNVTALADVDFTLGTDTTNIKALCNTIVRGMTDELGASPMTRVYALCGDDFYDELSTHPEVKAAYARQQDGAFLREGGAVYESFTYGNITWENYRGAVNGTPFIPTADCRFFPVGVQGLFQNWFAPADYNETVNTRGLPRYAKLIPDNNDKGASLEAQTNPLPICTRPRTLRRGFTSN